MHERVPSVTAENVNGSGLAGAFVGDCPAPTLTLTAVSLVTAVTADPYLLYFRRLESMYNRKVPSLLSRLTPASVLALAASLPH